VSACASMWWIGIRGLLNFRLRYRAYWDPILRREENYSTSTWNLSLRTSIKNMLH
jgi:hypothetical protein